jgi:hypothetical protein
MYYHAPHDKLTDVHTATAAVAASPAAATTTPALVSPTLRLRLFCPQPKPPSNDTRTPTARPLTPLTPVPATAVSFPTPFVDVSSADPKFTFRECPLHDTPEATGAIFFREFLTHYPGKHARGPSTLEIATIKRLCPSWAGSHGPPAEGLLLGQFSEEKSYDHRYAHCAQLLPSPHLHSASTVIGPTPSFGQPTFTKPNSTK